MSEAADETTTLELKFDANGLIPAIVTNAADGVVLMFAHMNREAFDTTRETGHLHFYSRSRRQLWKKGETSGETFAVVEILTDCDQDVVQIKVKPEGKGAACHTGRKSCFYRRLEKGELEIVDTKRLFNPATAYKR
jgi:phosphoribosyl-AMP cyclohydrolase